MEMTKRREIEPEIQAFLDIDMVSIIAVPGVTDQKVQRSLTAHCERKNRFAVLHMPQEAKELQDIIRHRKILIYPMRLSIIHG